MLNENFEDAEPPTDEDTAKKKKQSNCPDEGAEKWQYKRKNLKVPEQKPDTPQVLEPDHPLLEKFQLALKEHLTKFLAHLHEEVSNLDCEVKEKSKLHEEMGVRSYDIQQLINAQQKQIESNQKDMIDVNASIEEYENNVQDTNEKCKEQKTKLMEAESKEKELRLEMEAMDLLEFQMMKCEETLESEIAVNQRIADKTHKEKLQYIEEKRQLDIMTYKLTKEVWRLEGEIETMSMQLNVQESEREKLAETVAKSNIEIETFEAEYRCLMHSWNSVVVAIGQRDRIYTTYKEMESKKMEEMRTVHGEIETVKKLCKKEMERNELLTMMKSRSEYDIDNLTKVMETENNKKNHLERVMGEHQSIIDQMDKDYSLIQTEQKRNELEMRQLCLNHEKFNKIRGDLEEEILLKLQDQITNDKAAMFLSKSVRENRDMNKSMEANLSAIETKISTVRADIENQKCENDNRQRLCDQINNEQQELIKKIEELKSTISKYTHIILKKQTELELVKDRLDVLLEKNNKVTISPEEQKINVLEKTIAETEVQNKQLQNFWLSQQVYVVRLSGERQKQIYDINLLRKQILILQQKNLKITDDLEATNNKEKRISRNISNLHTKLLQISAQFYEHKEMEEFLTNEKGLFELEAYTKLQGMEMDCLKVEEEISLMENEKISMSSELLQLNRVALEWEKKVIMVTEAKQKVKDEKSAGGEVGGMKAEIHRMEVRYGQLKRVQEQLIHDLEYCVTRRDSIIALAEAREKRSKEGCSKTRINFQRKLDEMKSKLKSLEGQIDFAQSTIESLKEDEEKIIADVHNKENDIGKLQNEIGELQVSVEMAKSEKQKNLQILLHKQRQIKLYTDFTKDKFKPLYRTDSALQTEYAQQKTLHNKLETIVECLINDFPQYNHIFHRILNVLRVDLS